MKGFTLFEMMITIGIFAVLVVIAVPIALRFLGTQNIDDATTTLVASLRQQHNTARFQKNDASFGIKFLEDSYVNFQGDSYTARDTDEDIVIVLPSGITISGLDEIVFMKRTGIPDVIGTLLVQSSSENRSVTINQQGIIESL